ncbi:hypothetical protein [Roseivivax sp. THAF30]|uniref:hypothetical protein n=1 Tax=Roseivivax sp. THAF30 TaxID=2587852 RepID=UPI0012691FC3|nr:hypothetical protein [Roseivivax sp. THAF30]QFT61818.1 hypothetical protein FIU91_02660 [Roseivivax sp. THAF30]
MSQSWLETIAAKTDLTPDQAEKRLRGWGIVPDRAARPAPSFVIERLAFSGEKKGETRGPIDFEWAGLGPGIWAITSNRNLRGKSTVLEVILWCLRGVPKNLQDDVRGWLSKVALEFAVGNEHHRIVFDLVDGVPQGRLDRRAADGAYHPRESFTSDEGFALAMSHFMMGSLDLDILPAMQGGDYDREVIEHGWLALSNVFYLGGEHKVLLGDTQMAGLPARMLQMYVGIPWASTKTFVTTAKKEIEQKRSKADRAARSFKAEAEAAQTRLEAEITAARAALAALPMETTTAEALEQAGTAVASATRKMSELQARAAKAEADADRVQAVAVEDERSVRNLRETIVATQFFNGLNPECCPRCETKVASARIKAEVADLSCSICAEPIPEDRFEDLSEELEAAEKRAAASKSAGDRAEADRAAASAAAKGASNDLTEAQQNLNELVKRADFAAKRNAELELARLEGALKERSAAPRDIEADPDETLIAVAEKETAKAYNAGRTGILEALNDEILPLSRQLGIEALEAVDLRSNASLIIWKGGAKTSFSQVTAGERLRLRLATVIALLRVGRRFGIGRHPGLLIIDSPGKEEVTKVNLEALLGELKKIAEEMGDLQVIVAGTDADEIAGVLGEEHCRIAHGEDYVW